MTEMATAPVGLSTLEAARRVGRSRTSVVRAMVRGELVHAWATSTTRVVFEADLLAWDAALRQKEAGDGDDR
jgi:hypothetical protein